MALNSVWEWTIPLTIRVAICPYRDGKLIYVLGHMPSNTAFHLDDEDDDDEILYAKFPNLGEIIRYDENNQRIGS
jgi:hypothetical protein